MEVEQTVRVCQKRRYFRNGVRQYTCGTMGKCGFRRRPREKGQNDCRMWIIATPRCNPRNQWNTVGMWNSKPNSSSLASASTRPWAPDGTQQPQAPNPRSSHKTPKTTQKTYVKENRGTQSSSHLVMFHLERILFGALGAKTQYTPMFWHLKNGKPTIFVYICDVFAPEQKHSS